MTSCTRCGAVSPIEAAREFERRFVAALAPRPRMRISRRSARSSASSGARTQRRRRCSAISTCSRSTRTRRTGSRTVATFYLLLKRHIESAPAADEFVDALGDELTRQQKPFSVLRERFAAIEPREQGNILDLLKARKGAAAQALSKPSSVLAELKDAYRRKNHKEAPSLAALLAFDPLPDDDHLHRDYDRWLKIFNDAYDDCVAQSDQRAFINLRLGSQAFRKFVKAQYVDGLRLFQLLSYWRRDMAHATSSKVDEIAYLQIAAGLLSYALGIKSYDLNIRLKSFTADEKDFQGPTQEARVLHELQDAARSTVQKRPCI